MFQGAKIDAYEVLTSITHNNPHCPDVSDVRAYAVFTTGTSGGIIAPITLDIDFIIADNNLSK